MKGVGANSKGRGATSSTNVIDFFCTIAISGGGIRSTKDGGISGIRVEDGG
jgi:hypothetical protein